MLNKDFQGCVVQGQNAALIYFETGRSPRFKSGHSHFILRTEEHRSQTRMPAGREDEVLSQQERVRIKKSLSVTTP